MRALRSGCRSSPERRLTDGVNVIHNVSLIHKRAGTMRTTHRPTDPPPSRHRHHRPARWRVAFAVLTVVVGLVGSLVGAPAAHARTRPAPEPEPAARAVDPKTPTSATPSTAAPTSTKP